MISEKTVEINLTTELTNYISYLTNGNNRPFILSPSQPVEAVTGYDVELGIPNGSSMFIQYKRALPRRYGYKYDLNKTSQKDQHLRLFVLELLGCNVFYALPIFHTETMVITHRRRLLLRTVFIRPSSMLPFGSMTGPHYVKYDIRRNLWTMHSEERKIEQTLEVEEVIRMLNNNEITNENNIKFSMKQFNKIFYNEVKLNLNKILPKSTLEKLEIKDKFIVPYNRKDIRLTKSIQLIGITSY